MLDELLKIDLEILSMKHAVSLYGIHCLCSQPWQSWVQLMQFKWVMKSPLFSFTLAHSLTRQQSALQKVVSEIPGSGTY